MKAAEIMVTNVIAVTPDQSVQEVAEILLERRISGVPVRQRRGRTRRHRERGRSDAARRRRHGASSVMVAAAADGPGGTCPGIRQGARAQGRGYHDAPRHHRVARDAGQRPGRAARAQRHQARSDRRWPQGGRHRQPRQPVAGAGRAAQADHGRKTGRRRRLARPRPGAIEVRAVDADIAHQRHRCTTAPSICGELSTRRARRTRCAWRRKSPPASARSTMRSSCVRWIISRKRWQSTVCGRPSAGLPFPAASLPLPCRRPIRRRASHSAGAARCR